jgi:hypothetical protein
MLSVIVDDVVDVVDVVSEGNKAHNLNLRTNEAKKKK